MLSALLAHCVNLFLAVLLQQLVKRGDGCIWYFVNLVMDSTLGISLCYAIHNAIDRFAVRHDIDALKSGLYFTGEDKPTDDNIDYRVWLVQLVVWCIIVLLSKLVLFGVQLYTSEDLEWFGEKALEGFAGNPRMELIFVMVVLPLILNSVQYWVQDNFLQGTKHMVERAERLAQLEQFKMVEGDFVMVDPSMEDRKIEENQRLNRLIEEGVYNIKPEDYNEEGELKEEALPEGGFVVLDGQEVPHQSPPKECEAATHAAEPNHFKL